MFLATLTIMPANARAQSIHLTWAEDGSRCWFASTIESGSKTFYVVDIAQRTCQPAFEHERVAKALADLLGADVESTKLPIDSIAFTDQRDQWQLLGRESVWQLDLTSYEISQLADSSAIIQKPRLFLPPRSSRNGGESTEIIVDNQLDQAIQLAWIDTGGAEQNYAVIEAGATRTQHTYVGHNWLLQSIQGDRLGCFTARRGDRVVIDHASIINVRRETGRNERRGSGRFGNRRDRANRAAESPDGEWTAFVRDHDLWVSRDGEEFPLNQEASEDNSFEREGSRSPDVYWSPDSNYLVAFQTTRVPERTVYYIESSPENQLQPELQSYEYRKPGDDLPEPTVHLFSLTEKHEIPVSQDLFSNPWSLRFRGWSPAADRFTLHFNQRGHQTLRVLEVSVVDGSVRTIIEENSPTFIQYSDPGKSVCEDLNDDEILWASERSGWNHLYRYSRASGTVINAVTSGDWNMKRIVKLDRDAQSIWFMAVGLYSDQDPYHEHFCRVNFDGSEFKILTSSDGTHEIDFEQDGRYFIDTFSRVDLAPVTKLCDSQTGEEICELQREDTSERFTGRRLTERFVAKGRDGQTDIWGIIHWPQDFDPEQKYPVVENIYAGPHDHHVPKSFRARFGHQHRIADAGIIVVQIDGMGTAWRSKQFHDVCYKNLRDAGFPDRIAWLRAAAKQYPQMDLTRVGIYGGSAGGQNAMAALLWHHDFYQVAVADCGCHDNRMDKIWWNEQWMGWPVDASYRTNSNMENAHLLQGDLMLIVGELDRNVDPATTTQVVRQLIKHDKDFEFVLVAGAGHGAAETPWASRQRLNFLKRHLLPHTLAD